MHWGVENTQNGGDWKVYDLSGHVTAITSCRTPYASEAAEHPRVH